MLAKVQKEVTKEGIVPTVQDPDPYQPRYATPDRMVRDMVRVLGVGTFLTTHQASQVWRIEDLQVGVTPLWTTKLVIGMVWASAVTSHKEHGS